MSKQIEATRSGLVAIKSILSRDPCGHANTAIQMIEAMLAEQPAQPLTPEWYARWIRNNYQDHPNIATLCDEMTKAAHGIKEQK